LFLVQSTRWEGIYDVLAIARQIGAAASGWWRVAQAHFSKRIGASGMRRKA